MVEGAFGKRRHQGLAPSTASRSPSPFASLWGGMPGPPYRAGAFFTYASSQRVISHSVCPTDSRAR